MILNKKASIWFGFQDRWFGTINFRVGFSLNFVYKIHINFFGVSEALYIEIVFISYIIGSQHFINQLCDGIPQELRFYGFSEVSVVWHFFIFVQRAESAQRYDRQVGHY